VQRNAAFCEDVIDESGQEIGNDGSATHYRTREGHEDESVIDLTTTNRPLTKWAILDDDHTTTSTEVVIDWDLETD